MKRSTSAVIAASVLAGFAACASAQAAATKPYKVVLSNNFVGNDWRQQMIRSAQTAVTKAPLAGEVELTIENVDNTTEAQIASLNNIIRSHPDAIVVDAGSGAGLNPTIEKACAAGIVVVSFDQVVTADCAYKLSSDFDTMANNQAEWMAAILNGKGKVFIDRGLAGTPVSAQFVTDFEKVLKNYPGIEIEGYYNGNYAIGPEQEGVSSLLAAHPQVDGIFTQAYGTGAMKALENAGAAQVPIVAAAFNGTALACVQTAGAKCILGANPPYLSAEAIKLAVDVLDGKTPPSKTVLFKSPDMSTDPIQAKYAPGSSMQKLELGKNVFPDLAPGVSLPISPGWVEITPSEAAGTK